jgi:hypothetical protein
MYEYNAGVGLGLEIMSRTNNRPQGLGQSRPVVTVPIANGRPCPNTTDRYLTPLLTVSLVMNR